LTDPTDALTTDITLTDATVKFIQRMPVTKVVDEITVGDIGQAASCTTPSRTRLYIREHVGEDDLGGDYYSSQQIVYSTGYVSLTNTPAPVTYAIPPTTFRKGRGYSFVLSANYSSTDCKAGRQTTWAHNEPKINAGPALCTGAPTDKRMWHVGGLDDANAFCVTRPPGSRTFAPDMPTGWLVSRAPGVNWDIMSGSYPSTDPIPASSCGTSSGGSPLALGAGPVFWRFRPDSSGTISEYICRWSQFADHETTVEDGWYYAQPWLVAKGGAARDMYLRLDTIDYDALLEKHSPTLKFDADENFYPQDAGAMTDFHDPPSSGYEVDSAYTNILRDGAEQILAAAGSPGPGAGIFPPPLDLASLGATYGFGSGEIPSSPDDWIDARGSTPLQYQTDAVDMYTIGYDDVTYGRVVYDPSDDQLWLQYWFFYYFNSYEVSGLGVHEGDWEMVQIGLGSTQTPQHMTFAVHGYAYGLDWSEVEKVGPTMDSPVVYVAARSHASYPESGESPIDVEDWFDPTDDHYGDDFAQRPVLQEINSETAWTGWKGRWGASRDGSFQSPINPSEQGDRWDQPSAFHTSAREW